MHLVYDKKSGSVTDIDTGMVLAQRGWFDDGDNPFGFRDPRFPARSVDGDEWLLFSAAFLYPHEAEAGKHQKPIGFRIVRGALHCTLRPYAGTDAEKYEHAEHFIVAALKKYMGTLDSLANPVVELV